MNFRTNHNFNRTATRRIPGAFSMAWLACWFAGGCGGITPPANDPQAAARREREVKKAEQVIGYTKVQAKNPHQTRRKFAGPFFIADLSTERQGEWITGPIPDTTEDLQQAQTVVLFSLKRTKVDEPLRFGAPDRLPLGNEDGYRASADIRVYDVRNPRRSRLLGITVEPVAESGSPPPKISGIDDPGTCSSYAEFLTRALAQLSADRSDPGFDPADEPAVGILTQSVESGGMYGPFLVMSRDGKWLGSVTTEMFGALAHVWSLENNRELPPFVASDPLVYSRPTNPYPKLLAATPARKDFGKPPGPELNLLHLVEFPGNKLSHTLPIGEALSRIAPSDGWSKLPPFIEGTVSIGSEASLVRVALSEEKEAEASRRQVNCFLSYPDGKLLGQDALAPFYKPATAVSPDSRYVAYERQQNRDSPSAVYLWSADNRSGEYLPQTSGFHTPQILDVMFSPDGTLLLTACADRVGVWSLPDGKPLAALQDSTSPCTVSLDGQFLACRSKSGESCVYRLPTGGLACKLTVRGKLMPVTSFVFAPAGETLFSAHEDGEIFSWDTATGTRRQ